MCSGKLSVLRVIIKGIKMFEAHAQLKTNAYHFNKNPFNKWLMHLSLSKSERICFHWVHKWHVFQFYDLWVRVEVPNRRFTCWNKLSSTCVSHQLLSARLCIIARSARFHLGEPWQYFDNGVIVCYIPHRSFPFCHRCGLYNVSRWIRLCFIKKKKETLNVVLLPAQV